MIDPGDTVGNFHFPDKGGKRISSPCVACGLGCLLSGVVLFVLVTVLATGLGRPYLYWLHLSDIQIFDGPNGIVLFAEVERTMRYPGFWQTSPIRKTIRLFQIKVSQDGRMSRVSLKFDGNTTFNTNIAPIVKLPDHFYLVKQPSLGSPSCQLHRINGGCIEPLSVEESGVILRTIGLRGDGNRRIDDFEEYDVISRRNGWQRLNGSSYSLSLGIEDPIVSERHQLHLRFVEAALSQTIIADSFSEAGHWSKPLIRVSTKRWKSYQDPRH